MKKRLFIARSISCVMVCTLFLTGCLGRDSVAQEQEETTREQEIPKSAEINDPEENADELSIEAASGSKVSGPEMIETDWSEYFDGLNGAAVIYDASARRFYIYDRLLAETRRSPCSTFKIISSLIALENGIIDPLASTRKWSGDRKSVV